MRVYRRRRRFSMKPKSHHHHHPHPSERRIKTEAEKRRHETQAKSVYRQRFTFAFAISALFIVVILGAVRNKTENTPVDVSTQHIPAYVCNAYGGHPVSAIRTQWEPEFSLYTVTCSNGLTVQASW